MFLNLFGAIILLYACILMSRIKYSRLCLSSLPGNGGGMSADMGQG